MLVNAIQLQQMYLHLLIQLTTALRPIGRSTQFAPSLENLSIWCATKSSVQFAERNIAPLQAKLRVQLEEANKDIVWLKRRLVLDGVSFTTQENNSESLPCELVYHKGTLTFKRLTGAGFRRHIEAFIEKNQLNIILPEKANNVFRHIIATETYSSVPETILGEFMAHNRDGLDMFNPWSTASAKAFPMIETAIDELAKCIPLQPLVLRNTDE